MASHVVVIDSTARRHIIKTTPAKYLSDVLQEACTKFGLNADQYGLKHNDKPVDLSRTLRLSGLTSGAKLSLVQSSRSPSVVSVALQLPPSDILSDGTSRLFDKVPSTTTLWQILRRFESSSTSAHQQQQRNYTQRSTPVMANGDAVGPGRLCYEMPVVNIMGRELSNLEDLQKTLAQLGIKDGSAMMRMSFRVTEQPLEEAMLAISNYFRTFENTPIPVETQSHTSQSRAAKTITQEAEISSSETSDLSTGQNASLHHSSVDGPSDHSNSTSMTPIEIFSPPVSSTPASAKIASHDDADYTPSIDHAKRHQSLLNKQSRNQRLLSDAEMEARSQERSERLSSVSSVLVRFRFPDQSQAQRSFTKEATVLDLFNTCRELLNESASGSFNIRTTDLHGSTILLQESSQRLVHDLGWKGRVLVLVTWTDTVDENVKKRPCLKPQYQIQAKELQVEVDAQRGQREHAATASEPPKDDDAQQKSREDMTTNREAKMKRLLGKLSRK